MNGPLHLDFSRSRRRPVELLVSVLVSISLAGCDLFMSPQARMQRARQELARGEYRAALIDVRNVTDADPKNAAAWLLEAHVSLLLGDPASALQSLNVAVEAGASAERTGVLKARIDLALGKPDRLLADVDSPAFRLREPDRSVYRGKAFAALKRYADAASAYRSALAAVPSSVEARLGLAEVDAAQGRLDTALQLLDYVQATRPSLAAAWYLRGTIEGRRDRFRAMEHALTEAWRLRAGQLSVPERVEVLAALIDARLALGETAAAQASLEQLRSTAPVALLTQLQTGRLAMTRRDYAAAIAPLTAVIQAAPELVEARFMLGSALLAEHQLGRAEHELGMVVAQAPENVAAREQLARARLALGMPNDAVSALSPLQQSSVVEGDPQFAALLGLAEAQSGQSGAAIAELEKASRAQPASYRLKLLLAQLYERSGKPERASPLIEQALQSAGGHAEVLRDAGQLYLQIGRYDRALATFQAAADARPRDPAYRIEVARAHLALSRPGSAADDARAALDIRPDFAPALRVLALIDVSSGHTEDALARVRAAERRRVADVDLIVLEGDIHMAAHQYTEADEAYAHASAVHATPEAAVKSYLVRRKAHLPHELQPLEQWLVLKPGDLGVRRILAGAYLAAGRRAEALRMYETIVASAPTDVISLNNLAWLYTREGDARAVDTARKAYELAPSNPAVADTYGWSLLKAGDSRTAVKVLQTAVSEGGDGDIRYHLASALARTGERDEARAELHRLFESNPKGFSERADAERLLEQL